mgnify:CR=1 FL=1|jgi:hypothetical protein
MTKGGSVVVETLASTKAIICAPSLLIDDFVEEKEFIVDRRKLTAVKVIQRYSSSPEPD